MAKTFELQGPDGTQLLDLMNYTGVALVDEPMDRPLSYKAGALETRVFRFTVTGSTRALARSAANAFVAALRTAVRWTEDDLLENSVFLAEAAEGETVTRKLVVDFSAAIDKRGKTNHAFQEFSFRIVVSVAITTQNQHEEETAKTLSTTGTPSNQANGSSVILRDVTQNPVMSRDSRISRMQLTSSVSSGNALNRLWVGIMPYSAAVNTAYPYAGLIWRADQALGSAYDVALASSSGSVGAQVMRISFTDALLQERVYFAFSDPDFWEPPPGEYLILMRYKVNSGGTVMARMGSAYATGAGLTPAYNEARLLDNSGNWRLMPMGVIKFPARGARYEMRLSGGGLVKAENTTLVFDAQRLTGSSTLDIDTIAFVPYKHFLWLEGIYLFTGSVLHIVQHESGDVEAFTRDASLNLLAYAKVIESRNWSFPYSSDDYNPAFVFWAAEREALHGATDNIALSTTSIYPTWEAYGE